MADSTNEPNPELQAPTQSPPVAQGAEVAPAAGEEKSTAPTPTAEPITNFNIGEEFGTAKRNLPPAGIVAIAIAIVAIVVGVIAFRERAQPQGVGSVNFVSAAEVPGQNIVLAAITLTLHNSGEKSLWIRSLMAQLTTSDGHTYDDQAASAVDLDRYYQLFPALKESTEAPLSPETRLLPGTDKKGTIVVSFPVSKEAFDQRRSLTVNIQPYDQPLPVVLK